MRKIVLISLLLSFFSMAQAAEPLKISFNDLQGKVAPYKDPFRDLTEDQLYNLSIYARISEMMKSIPARVTEEMKIEAENAHAKLISEKIDIEYLFEQRLIIMEKRKVASMATNELLANKKIEMGGYMLALEFDNGLVTEFLLVPTIGACSHKPVPPANQLVLVTAKQPVKAGSAYMPIRVTGMLRVTPQSKDLYLVDGQKNIEMSYSLEDAKVEPFIATH